MSKIRIINVRILDADQDQPSKPCDIVIEHGRFSQIVDAHVPSDIPETFNDSETTFDPTITIDGSGLYALPGLIDCHAHPFLADTNLARLNEVPPTLMAARAANILEKMLMRGFTTIRDATGADWGIKQAVEEGSIIGPRLFIAGRALSQTGGHGDMRAKTDTSLACSCAHALAYTSRIADGVDEVRKAVREELRQGADQIKIMVSGGVSSPHDPLECDQYSSDEIRTIVEEAKRRGTYVMAHAYGASAIKIAVAQGVRTIEHGNLIDQEAAELMAANDAFLVPTLITYTVLEEAGRENGWSEAMLDKLKIVKDAGLKSLELCRAAGVQVGLGTDLLGDSFDHQSREFIVRSEVEPVREAIRSATIVNAKILNRANELGVIKKDAIADVLLLSGNPFEEPDVLQYQGKYMPVIIKSGNVYKNTISS